MTRRTFIFASLLAMSITVSQAAQKKVSIKITQKKDVSDKILRSPINLPIEVTYDEDVNVIETFCVNDVDAEVSVYNASDELEGYSPSLNSVISLTESDYHTIVIEGDDWIATGVIE
ncbi:MAG: hypothetical protein HDS97_02445 [Bacteroidales bacterium]|nr:hypothetical protein [Bacteroidales bacterium]